jgi:dihydroneopterin aldolase
MSNELYLYDYIHILDLDIPMTIGIHPWEKSIIQTLKLDIKCYIPQLERQDNLKNTLDYAEISANIRKVYQNKPINLIETVAEDTATWLLQNYSMIAVEVIVKKYHVIQKCQQLAVRVLRFSSGNCEIR